MICVSTTTSNYTHLQYIKAGYNHPGMTFGYKIIQIAETLHCSSNCISITIRTSHTSLSEENQQQQPQNPHKDTKIILKVLDPFLLHLH